MTWKPDYITAADLKAHMRVTDTDDDTAIAVVITAASRAIDYYCDRQFGQDATTSTRYYSADNQLFLDCGPAIAIDDVATTTSMVISTDLSNDGLFSTTMTVGTDVELWPYNANADSRPWTHLVLTPRATTYFPWTRRSVRVTAKFGWAAVPAVVKQGALIQANRWFMRREAWAGIAGSPEMGNEVRLLDQVDPDVAVLLNSVKRRWGAV
jgi:hypothetical protein